MPVRAKRHRLNGAHSHKAMHEAQPNQLWMHPPATNVPTKVALQTCWRWSQIVCAYLTITAALLRITSETAVFSERGISTMEGRRGSWSGLLIVDAGGLGDGVVGSERRREVL